MAYHAFILDRRSRETLLKACPPRYPDVIAHHITHDVGPKTGTRPHSPKRIHVIGHSYDDERGVQAAVVVVDGKRRQVNGNPYHVTISIDRSKGADPVHSNEVIARGYEKLRKPFPIRAQAAVVDNDVAEELIEAMLEGRTSKLPVHKQVADILTSNDGYRILDKHPTTAGGTWAAGGCAVYADVLQRCIGLGAEKHMVVDHHKAGHAEHVVVKQGSRYYDSNGEYSKASLLHTMRSQEGLRSPEVLPYDHAHVLGSGIPFDAHHAQQVYTFVQKKLRK